MRRLLASLLLCVSFAGGAVESLDRLSDAADGATCQYYNWGAGGAWVRKGGDWRDIDGRPYGEHPFAQGQASANQRRRTLEFDVTALVSAWQAGRADPAHGMLLRSTGGQQGIGVFFSREAAELLARPTLTLHFNDGSRRLLDAAADTFLDCTTEKGLGQATLFKAGGDFNAMLRFPVESIGPLKPLSRAILTLTLDRQYGDLSLGVFATSPPSSPDAAVRHGLAAGFPGDAGIESHPDVWFATGFEKIWWPLEWNGFDPRSDAGAISTDDPLLFQPLKGRALRVRLAKGANRGLDMRFAFAGHSGGEPEEAYFRYYLRLADDWSPDTDGGNLPGFAGTYGRAGWGMRKSTGNDGWSMRGLFYTMARPGNPRAGSTALGTYAYHADIAEAAGEAWPWPLGRLAALERNRWYSIEQHIRLNTPGLRDGIVRAWVDGRLVFERNDVRMRTVPELKIESVWFNVYHGGTLPAPRDMHLYIDNVVVARRYVGPMAGAR